jgi:uncharacterized repeat protein (TIGR01451 family)
MMLKRYVLLLLAVLCSLASASAASASASVSAPAPGWEIFTRATPTNLAPGGSGLIRVDAYNTGAAAGEAPTVTDTLPAGVTATSGTLSVGYEEGLGTHGAGAGGECTVASRIVTCTTGSVPPGAVIQVDIRVDVDADVQSGSEAVNEATVTGGGSLYPASESKPLMFNSKPPNFGFQGMDVWFTNANGTTDTQAGSHPYELTAVYAMNSTGTGGTFEEEPASDEARDMVANLPPGIIGNPTAVPRCTRKQFDGEISIVENAGPTCPPSTQVGVDQASVQGIAVSFKVYNLVPPPGVAAQFGFDLEGIPVFLDATVRSGGSSALSSDYGISEHIDNVPQRAVVYNATTIWGVPGEASHDAQRKEFEGGPGLPSGAGLTPFLTLPTSCEGPLEFSIEALNTWQSASTSASASVLSHNSTGAPLGLSGCDHLGFEPSITAAPDTSHADTPAGLTVDVEVPQRGLASPEALSTSNIKDTTVALPEGVAINPGQAAGLVACQAGEDGVGTEGPPHCPAASKVGTVEIATPLLADKLQGDVYILPANPPNLQLLVAASGDGVNLKLVGDVHLNEATGQLVTTFTNTPEVPFSDLKLAFSGGAQAALTTPTGCGTYQTTSDFTPWSTPLVQDVFPVSSFAIESGPDSTACQNPMPFHPELIAGATTDQAGGYTGFSLLLQRGDGQQRIKDLQFKTPEGLLGMISKVPLCGEPQAAQGTCSEASQIGHTVVTAGPGPYPLVVPEPGQPPAPIYLTGGYKGAPYGLSIVVPIDAGPFNLGTEVVRARIEVDPHTAQLTVSTDPLPTIIKGIPADLRVVNAVIDRPGFMFNPTSCAPMSFAGTATSTEGVSAPITSHFQVGSCQALKFQPNFKVSTSGKTSRANGASLDAKIVYPTGELGFNQASSQSNIQTVKVELPKRLPSRLSTLQKACPAQVFEANPANCPPASAVGHATAITPVLPVPLTGPAYFVSHGGEAFPSLIVVLQGYGVTVDLVGTTFISKAGITSSTFKQVPDVPIGSFELVLPQGPFSALAANGNLCKGSMSMPTEFTGQNGAFLKQSTKMTVTGCPKAKKAKPKKTKRKPTKGKQGKQTGGGRHASAKGKHRKG